MRSSHTLGRSLLPGTGVLGGHLKTGHTWTGQIRPWASAPKRVSCSAAVPGRASRVFRRTAIAAPAEIVALRGEARRVIDLITLPRGRSLAVEACAPAAGASREDVRVVEEPIEERGDGGGVAEQLAPVLDGSR
jgi:hypothetical protein